MYYIFLCKAQFGAILKEVCEIMRIQSGNKRSITNGPQFKKFFSFDDGNIRIVSHQQISEILLVSVTIHVEGRLEKQLNRKTSNLLDIKEL